MDFFVEVEVELPLGLEIEGQPERIEWCVDTGGDTAELSIDYATVDVGGHSTLVEVDLRDIDPETMAAHLRTNVPEILNEEKEVTTDEAVDVLSTAAASGEYLSYDQLVELVLEQTQRNPGKIGGLVTGLIYRLEANQTP